MLKYVVLFVVIAAIFYKYNNVYENAPRYIVGGSVVYQKGTPNKFGLVMGTIGTDVQVWWEDQIKYDPFGKRPWFIKKESLVVADDHVLVHPIYKHPNTSVSESLVIGKQICHTLKVNCEQCYIITMYWKGYWMYDDIERNNRTSIDAINIQSLNEWYGCNDTFSPADPCFGEVKYLNPRRCVIRGCCKLAFEDPIPPYCDCR